MLACVPKEAKEGRQKNYELIVQLAQDALLSTADKAAIDDARKAATEWTAKRTTAVADLRKLKPFFLKRCQEAAARAKPAFEAYVASKHPQTSNQVGDAEKTLFPNISTCNGKYILLQQPFQVLLELGHEEGLGAYFVQVITAYCFVK